MMTDFAISALARMRAEMAGEAAALEARLAEVRDGLRHLDATILLFDPAFPLTTIRPKRPPAGDGPFGRGELTRLIYGALREADQPPTLAAITVQVMTAKGMDPNDDALSRDMQERVSRTLRKKVGRVLRRVALDNGATGWKVAAP